MVLFQKKEDNIWTYHIVVHGQWIFLYHLLGKAHPT